MKNIFPSDSVIFYLIHTHTHTFFIFLSPLGKSRRDFLSNCLVRRFNVSHSPLPSPYLPPSRFLVDVIRRSRVLVARSLIEATVLGRGTLAAQRHETSFDRINYGRAIVRAALRRRAGRTMISPETRDAVRKQRVRIVDR